MARKKYNGEEGKNDQLERYLRSRGSGSAGGKSGRETPPSAAAVPQPVSASPSSAPPAATSSGNDILDQYLRGREERKSRTEPTAAKAGAIEGQMAELERQRQMRQWRTQELAKTAAEAARSGIRSVGQVFNRDPAATAGAAAERTMRMNQLYQAMADEAARTGNQELLRYAQERSQETVGQAQEVYRQQRTAGTTGIPGAVQGALAAQERLAGGMQYQDRTPMDRDTGLQVRAYEAASKWAPVAAAFGDEQGLARDVGTMQRAADKIRRNEAEERERFYRENPTERIAATMTQEEIRQRIRDLSRGPTEDETRHYTEALDLLNAENVGLFPDENDPKVQAAREQYRQASEGYNGSKINRDELRRYQQALQIRTYQDKAKQVQEISSAAMADPAFAGTDVHPSASLQQKLGTDSRQHDAAERFRLEYYSLDRNTERKVFNYLWNRDEAEGDTAHTQALQYLRTIPDIEERYYTAYANKWYIPQGYDSTPVAAEKVLSYIVDSLLSGSESALAQGMDALEGRVPSGEARNTRELSAAMQNSGMFYRALGGAAQSAGRMLPAMMTGTVAAGFMEMFPVAAVSIAEATEGVVTAERIVKGAQNTTFFLTSKGAALQEGMAKGLNREQAEIYSTLSALSEVGLQNLIGGIASFGGIGERQIAAKIARIDNVFLRTAAHVGAEIFGEEIEENAQNWLEPLIVSMLTGDEFQAPTWEETLDTILSTALMVGSMNVGDTASYYNGSKIRANLRSISDTFRAEGGDYGRIAADIDAWIQEVDADPEARFTPEDFGKVFDIIGKGRDAMRQHDVTPQEIVETIRAKQGEVDREAGTAHREEAPVVQTVQRQSAEDQPSAALESVEAEGRELGLRSAEKMSDAEIRETVETLRALIEDQGQTETGAASLRGQIRGLQEVLNERAVARGDDLGLAEGLGRVGVEDGRAASQSGRQIARAAGGLNNGRIQGGSEVGRTAGTAATSSVSLGADTFPSRGRLDGGQIARAAGDGGSIRGPVPYGSGTRDGGPVPYGNGGLNDGRIQGGSEVGGAGGQLTERTAGITDGGQRNGGLDPRGPAGVLGAGAGGAEGRAAERGGSRKEELAAIRHYVQAQGAERRSARDLGVRDGTKNARNVLLEGEALSDGMVRLQADAEQAGTRLDFVTGQIEIRTGGKVRTAAGVLQIDADGTPHIFVQADSRARSPEQLYRHELFHSIVAQNQGLWQQIVEHLNRNYTQEEIASIVGSYIDAFEGCYGYGEADVEAYLEEIFADIYAEMDRGGGRERASREALQPVAQRFAGDIENARQNRAGIERRNGPGTRLAFAGENAETADAAALEEARRLIEEGVDSETVRQRTGWFQGMDGRWRYEIDDSSMEFRRQGDMQSMRDPEYREYLELWDKVVARLEGTEAEMDRLRELDKRFSSVGRVAAYKLRDGTATLPDIIRHDALFQAYPKLRDVRVQFADLKSGVKASYDEKTNTIKVSYTLQGKPEGTLIHEIQHAIQGIEGFAKGSNMGYWANRIRADRAREVSEAEAEVRRLFDALPEEIKGRVRRYNQANLNKDYDLAIEIEDQLYSDGYGDQLSEYLDAVTFLDLERRRQRDQDYKAGSADLYFRTAGEVEARDAASRREFSTEQRKNTRPDVDRRDVVFAGQRAGQGEMLSVSDTEAHSPEQLAVIREYQNSSDPEVENAFIEKYQNPNAKFRRITISQVSERQASDASRLLGGNFSGYTNAINSNGIQHTIVRHGPNGKQDHSMADFRDAGRIGYVLDNYDTVEIALDKDGKPDVSREFLDEKHRPAPKLKYSKRVDGTYYIIQAVPETSVKKMWVVSAYMQKADSVTQTLDVQSPLATSETSFASPLPADSSIAEGTPGVKGNPEETVDWAGNRDIRVSPAEEEDGVDWIGNEEATKEEDQEYLALVKDPKKNKYRLQKMVADAARKAGYVRALYHGTPETFTSFRMGGQGIHLGTKQQAREFGKGWMTSYQWSDIRDHIFEMDETSRRDLVRAAKKLDGYSWRETGLGIKPYTGSLSDVNAITEYVDSAVDAIRSEMGSETTDPSFTIHTWDREVSPDVMRLYARISSPFVVDKDLEIWDPVVICSELLERSNEAEIGPNDSEIQLNDEQRAKLEAIVRGDTKGDERWSEIADVLSQHGYDSIKYLNTFEGSGDEYSYLALRPGDVKSADSIVRDDSGKVIPLSERFRTDRTGTEAWKNRDIRFSPAEEEDGVDRAGNETEDDAPPHPSASQTPSPQGEGSGGTENPSPTDAAEDEEDAEAVGLAREKKVALAEKATIDGLKSRIQSAEDRLRALKAMQSTGLLARDAQSQAEWKRRIADVEETLEIDRAALKAKQDARKAEKADKAKQAAKRAERKREKAAAKKEAELAADKPRQARKEFREGALDLFGVPSGKRKALGNILNDFADRMIEQGSVSDADRRDLFRQLYEAGADIIPADETYESIRDFVKQGRIYVPDSVRADFGDDWGDFQRRAWGNRIYLTYDRNDRGIDSWQSELAEMWPGSFDAEELDARTMLENLVDLAEAGQAERVTIGEMMRRNYAETGMTVDMQMDELEQKVDRLIDTFAQKANLERQVRTEGAMKLARERKRNRERVEREQQRRRENQTRAEVMKQLQQLNKMRKKSAPEIREKIDEIIGNLDTMARQITPAGLENLQELARKYNEAKDDPNFLGNPYVEQRLARLGQVQLDDLEISDVIELGRTISALVKSVQENKQLLTDARNAEISAAAGEAAREIRESAGSRGGKLRDFYGKQHLSPTRLIQMLGGWTRGGRMEQLAQALEDGGTRRLEYMRQATRIFDGFTSDKANQKWLRKAQGKDAEWISVTVPVGITDAGGTVHVENQTIEITPMMRVGLLMHSRNVDNLRHIETGGIVIPDKGWYRKGNLAEADARGTRVKLRPETVRAIVKDCTAQERAFAALLEKYYDGFSKDRINEVSMEIDGFERAGGDHYYGIKVSRKFLAAQPEQIQRNMSLESIGSIVNERIHAGNPIILEDASTALTDHIDLISKYYGFTAPIRDFNAVMNYTFHEKAQGEDGEYVANAYAGSIKEILQDKWGSGAQAYLDKMLADLQQSSGVTDSVAQFMAKLRGNLAGASLMFNPAVALSQTASLPGAMQSLGPAALMAGLKPAKVDMGLVEKYSPVLWYRNQGNSTQELGDYLKARGFEGKLPWFFGWIQKMDSWTIRRLWAAAEYKVRHETDLTPGSQAEIDAGTDPFYQEVARYFQRAVYDTQPNYTEMQRPGVLRTDSDLMKFMTMYKTVPLQYYNMMYEAAGRWKADAARAKANDNKANQENLKKSRSFAVQTFAGILGANVVYVVMKAAIKALTGRGKKYEDEEGDITLQSALPALGKDLAETYAGSLIFGSELLSSLEKFYDAATTGSYSRYGGMEISAFSAIEDTIGELYNLASRLQKEDYRGGLDAIKELAKQLAMDFGFPANNVETYLMGAARWIAPEWVDRYENLFDEFERGDVAGLHGRELEAGIRVLMDNRTEGLRDETITELARLFGVGYNQQLPTGIPSKVTVDGEEIQLGWKDREQYRETWSQVVQEQMETLLASDGYEAADDKGKADLIKKLYDYAAQTAAGQVTGKGMDNWVQFGKACEDAGIPLEDYLAITAVSKDKLKDMDGTELDEAIRARMQFRVGELDDDVLDELGRLYEGGAAGVIPADVPTSFSVAGEEIKLTPEQRVSWMQAWQRTAGESLGALLATQAFQKASDEDKAKLIGALYDVASAAAKSEIQPGYEPDKWIRIGREAEARGISMSDYIVYRKTAAGASKAADKLKVLQDQKWTQDQKAFIWEQSLASETQLKKWATLRDSGVKWKDAMELLGAGESSGNTGMSEAEKARYDVEVEKISGPATKRLLNNSAYKKADKATKAAYLDRWNDYAGKLAKSKVIKGFDAGKWVEQGERLTKAGVQLDEYIVYYAGISDANSRAKYEALANTRWSESQKMIAMEYISTKTAGVAAVGRSYQIGLSWYLEGLTRADANENGSISQEEAEAYLDGIDLGREDKAYLWQMLCSSSKWKKNPYSTVAGEEIWHSLNPEG